MGIVKLGRGRALFKAFAVFAALACFVLTLGAGTALAATRATDVGKPDSGNEFVLVHGKFSYLSKDDILKRVNEIRKEACEEHVPNPENPSAKLSSSDYVPIKWSKDLETTAQTRAAEGCVVMDHQRPNGTTCFTAFPQNMRAWYWAENLAWNGGADILQGIDQWYEEKSDWVKQNSSAVTGHYTNMINPDINYIGIGAFDAESGGWGTVAADLAASSGLDEGQNEAAGECDQVIEVQSSKLSYELSVPKLLVGVAKRASLSGTLRSEDYWGNETSFAVSPYGTVEFSSKDETIATVDAERKVLGKGIGSTTITASYGGKAYQASVEVTDGAVVTVNVKKLTAKALNKAVKKAESDAAHVTTVVLGPKVQGISKRAFAGYGKVTVLKTQTRSLSAKSVKGSLTGSGVTTVQIDLGSAKANTSYAKKYKKVFKKKVCGKKVKIVASA